MISRLITFFIIIFSACLLNANAATTSPIYQQSDSEISQDNTKPQYLSDLLVKTKAISKTDIDEKPQTFVNTSFEHHNRNIVTHLKTYQRSQSLKLNNQKLIVSLLQAKMIKTYFNHQFYSPKKEYLAIL